VVQVCSIYAKDHATGHCPSLPGLKFFFKEVKEEMKPVYLMAQCHQWQARPPGTLQDPSSLFSRQYGQQHNSGNTWQGQPFANPTWQSNKYPTAPWPNQSVANPP
jgi:hypothetical protein